MVDGIEVTAKSLERLIMDAAKSIDLINKLIQEADVVRQKRNTFDAWRHKCSVVLDRVFGNDSKQS